MLPFCTQALEPAIIRPLSCLPHAASAPAGTSTTYPWAYIDGCHALLALGAPRSAGATSVARGTLNGRADPVKPRTLVLRVNDGTPNVL